MFSLMRQSKKKSEQKSLKYGQPAYCTQKTVKRRAPAINNTEGVRTKNPDGDENKDIMCPPSHNLRRAVELYNKKVES